MRLSPKALRTNVNNTLWAMTKGHLPSGHELSLAECIDLVNKQDDEIYKSPVQPLTDLQPSDDLQQYAAALSHISAELGAVAKNNLHDRRWHRAHLMTEELAEIIAGMAQCDEEKVIDGCGDMPVVVKGTPGRLGLGWALAAAFLEIMRSNFTKAAQNNDPDAFRIREKGAGYSPPRIREIFQQTLGRLPFKWEGESCSDDKPK